MTLKSKTPRRTQESRSAQTRAKLLQATINSLHTHGYTATTVMKVSEDAGVSRGAAQNQFNTKVDLMLFVVSEVYEEELRLYHQALDSIPDPRERLLAFPKLLWEVLSRPGGVAVLEIMQGARSDPMLSERLKPLQEEIERDSFKEAGELIGKPSGASPAMSRLLVWAIRGLSISQLLSKDANEILESVDLLQEMLATFIAKQDQAAGVKAK